MHLMLGPDEVPGNDQKAQENHTGSGEQELSHTVVP
jgi:hypothetical protein